MSSKKQMCFKSSPSPEAEAVMEAAAEDISIINTLPAEVILHILSNLSHGDLLWSRLVCTKWNDVVRTDPSFLQRSLFRICANSENGKTGGDILQNSNVKWKHLHIIDVKFLGTGTGEDFPVEIPIYLREEVQTLKISHSKMPWNGYQQILTQFPCLEELKIKRAELLEPSVPTEGKKELVPVTTLQSEFETLLNKVTSFSIIDCEIPTINVFLNGFQMHLKCLTTFAIKASAHDYDSSVLQLHCQYFYKGLFEVILGNSKSLKNLEITTRVPVPRGIENNFGYVIRKLYESPTASSLNLDTIYLRSQLFSDELDLPALVQFLKINKNVKRVSLPEIYGGDSESWTNKVQSFMTALPKDIVEVEVPKTCYFQAPHNGSLFDFFDKLEVIRIHERVHPSHHLLHGFSSSHVQNFGNSMLKNMNDVQRLTDVFPNLVHLQVTILTNGFAKAILQPICKHFRLLVSLDLTFKTEGWGEITDSDVTGIRAPRCIILQRLDPKSLGVMDVPAEEMNGLPLSSLRRLETLTIVITDMRITDVGLCFGFRFACLKYLNLRNTGLGQCRSRITPVGLNYLADFNKSLERVTLDKIVSERGRHRWVSTKEIEDFKLRLDRCKHFRINITLSEYVHNSYSSSSEGDDVDSVRITDFSDTSSSSSSSSDSDSDGTSDDDAP